MVICYYTVPPIHLIAPSRIAVSTAFSWTSVFERIATLPQGVTELQLHTSGYHRAKHNISLLLPKQHVKSSCSQKIGHNMWFKLIAKSYLQLNSIHIGRIGPET